MGRIFLRDDDDEDDGYDNGALVDDVSINDVPNNSYTRVSSSSFYSTFSSFRNTNDEKENENYNYNGNHNDHDGDDGYEGHCDSSTSIQQQQPQTKKRRTNSWRLLSSTLSLSSSLSRRRRRSDSSSSSEPEEGEILEEDEQEHDHVSDLDNNHTDTLQVDVDDEDDDNTTLSSKTWMIPKRVQVLTTRANNNDGQALNHHPTGIGGGGGGGGSDGVELHYHVYYCPQQEETVKQQTNKNKRSCCHGISSVATVVAIFAHILYWYGPSVPPPPLPQPVVLLQEHPNQNTNNHKFTNTKTLTWNEFIANEMDQTKEMMSRWMNVAYYVGFWCWQGIVTSTTTMPIKGTLDHSNAMDTDIKCSALPLQSFRWKSTHEMLVDTKNTQQPNTNKVLESQEYAWQRITTEWQQWKRNQPLQFYLIGGFGVGKQYMAHILFSTCMTTTTSKSDCRSTHSSKQQKDQDEEELVSNAAVTTSSSSPMLVIQPPSRRRTNTQPNTNEENDNQSNDNDNNEDDSNSLLQMVQEQLWNHVKTYSNGSIVVMNHVQEYDKNVVCQMLEYFQHHKLPFSKTIVLWTSDFGTRTIDKTLRYYYTLSKSSNSNSNTMENEQQQYNDGGFMDNNHHYRVPMMPLESYLEMEINDYHDCTSSPPSTLSAKTYSTTTVTAMPWKVLFLLPWNDVAVMQTLTVQLHQQWGIGKITAKSMENLLERFEWKTWIHKTSKKELATFSATGGLDIDKILERIPVHCRHYDDYSDNPDQIQQQQTISTSNRVVVLDTISRGRFQIFSCPPNKERMKSTNGNAKETDEESYNHPTGDDSDDDDGDDYDSCQEICQFSL